MVMPMMMPMMVSVMPMMPVMSSSTCINDDCFGIALKMGKLPPCKLDNVWHSSHRNVNGNGVGHVIRLAEQVQVVVHSPIEHLSRFSHHLIKLVKRSKTHVNLLNVGLAELLGLHRHRDRCNH